ncbi:MAG: exopolysaccharide biosynthesis protein [Fimbriimonadaceae bacterium]|nr:exopolysaccharide biosynthesis protein [Fimbriimonadaceae bacterium]
MSVVSAEAVRPPLSDIIEAAYKSDRDDLTLGDVLKQASESGFGLLLVFIALPIAAPFTPPGLSIPFGLLVLGLAFQILLKRESPIMPGWITKRPLKTEGKKNRFVEAMIKISRFFERWTKPRMTFWFKPTVFRAVVLPGIFMGGIVLLLPLPVVNTLSSGSVLLIGMGMVEEDGLFALVGVLAALLMTLTMLAFGIAVIQHGPDGIRMVEEGIKGLFRR